MEKILPGMALVEQAQHVVLDSLHGTGDHQTAGLAEGGEMLGMPQQVFDLDGDVIREAGKLPMQGMNQRQGMADAVEKIRVAKGHVLGASGDLLPDVFQNDLSLHDAKTSLVDRHDGAMAAEVFTAAAGFRVADHVGTRSDFELRVNGQGGQIAPVGHPERLAFQGNHVFRLLDGSWGICRKASHELQQPGFKFPTEEGGSPQFAQQPVVHGGVKAVETEVGLRVQGLDVLRNLNGDPRCGVHGDVESHEVGRQNGRVVEAAARQILALNRHACLSQPSSGRGQAKRLSPHFIGCKEYDMHGGHPWRLPLSSGQPT